MLFAVKFKSCESLFNYDLINKYLITNLFHTPKIKKISIDLSLTDIIIINDNINSLKKEHNLNLKSFLLFYFYFVRIPFILIKKFIKHNSKGEQEFFFKKICSIFYTSSNKINFFLFNLFIEKKILINNQGKKIINNFLVINKQVNSIKLHFFILAKFLTCFEKLSSFIFKRLNIKNINLKLVLNLLKPNKIQNFQLFLKNLPFFWINN